MQKYKKENEMKGKFITFEGGEGSGKSTQTKLLCDYFKDNNIEYVNTREPGGTLISEKIRELVLDAKMNNMSLETEILLFAASRAQLIDEVIKPSLDSGKVILCDRYIDSSIVYQGMTAGDNIDKVLWANKYAYEYCMPDVTFYFDIDPVLAFERKNGADENDRMEMKGLEFHNKVRDGFLKLSKKYPERIKIIDASKSVEDVTNQIKKILNDMGI